MKRAHSFLIITGIIFVFSACKSPSVNIDSNFEHGNIVLKEAIGDTLFVLKTRHSLKRDSIGKQYYWFYFKMDNLPERTIFLRFENLDGIYRGKPHVMYKNNPQFVFSYNQKDWMRMNESEYNENEKTYLVSQKFDKGPVWLAWAHPYTYSQSLHYMETIENNPYVAVEKIATSAHGRCIHLYSISKKGIPSINNETVVAMAHQHAGEDAGGFFLEGYTNFLLNNPDADMLLEKYNFLVISMMNPDGVVEGNTRYNGNMEDLNNIWDKPELMQPEVEGLEEWMKQYYAEGHRITRFIDVHCWGQETEHLYLSNNDLEFCEILNKEVHFAVFPSTSKSGATQYFQNTYGAKSATVELSQKTSNSDELLTPNDYRTAGAAYLKALLKQ